MGKIFLHPTIHGPPRLAAISLWLELASTPGSGCTAAEKNILYAARVFAYPHGMKAKVAAVSVSTFTWLPAAADERMKCAVGFQARAQRATAAHPDSQGKPNTTTR